MTWRSNLRAPVVISIVLMAFVSPISAKVIYVDVNAPGPTHDGSSWANAYKYLQDALADAGSATKPVEIRVAEGIYRPDETSTDPNGSNDRTATFQLINDVTLKGGYAGFGKPDPNKRDIEAYETILSGDLDGDDGSDFTNITDNSIHVVTGSGTEPNAVLDGFIIISGNAHGPYPDIYGGGMFNDNESSPRLFYCKFIGNSASFGGGICNLSNSSPIFTNCTISRNSASRGGGMFNRSSSPMVTNCTFSGNLAKEQGGGLQNEANSSPTLNNCSFSDNTTTLGCGGGIQNHESSPTLINCNFTRNSIKQGGGGIHNYISSPLLINCTFIGNSAQHGGGVYNAGGEPILKNCTFSGNLVSRNGGGICGANSNPTLTNCILWGDIPEEIYAFSSTPMVNYSDVQGGCPGLGNIDADPCFAKPGYWDPNGTSEDANDDFWIDGDYHLKSQAGRLDPNSESWVKDDVTSPCIDAGNPGCPVGDEPAPNGNRRNMGAYGGTAEASKSPTYWRSIADLTNDWIVDSNDLKVFVGYWLQAGECIPSDFDRSQFVDFNDFAIFGGKWRQKGPGPTMSYQIGGCIPVDFPSSAVVEFEPTRFTVTVEGQYILFEDMMRANCCPEELDVQMTVEADLITIYEIERFFTRVPCPCLCDFPITAKLGPFDPGTYILEVYQDETFVGTTTVTIGPAS